MTSVPDYILRYSTSSDEPLIYSAWTNGAWQCEPNSFIPHAMFKQYQSNHIKYCLDNYTTYVLAHPDDPEELFGFICFSTWNQTLLIHWLYIKSQFRGQGIASHLVESIYPDHKHQPIINTQYYKDFRKLREVLNLSYLPLEMNANKD